MPTVQNMLAEKTTKETYSVSATDTVYHALEVMAQYDIGGVMVMDGERYVGIFTERDYARKVILKGQVSKTMLVKEIMTSEMVTVSPDMTAEKCMALMTKYKIRHLPVVENRNVIGLISIGDVVKLLVEEKDITIRSLENFILGREMTT